MPPRVADTGGGDDWPSIRAARVETPAASISISRIANVAIGALPAWPLGRRAAPVRRVGSQCMLSVPVGVCLARRQQAGPRRTTAA